MRFCWTPILLILFTALPAQTASVQPCGSDNLDISFQAADSPDHGYTLAMNVRNVSFETCSLVGKPVGFGAFPRRPMEIDLAPGESAHRALSWSTSPSEPRQKCVSRAEMSWGLKDSWESIQLHSPSLLRPICSKLVTTDYAPGQFLSETFAELTAYRRLPVIRWANDETASYSLEHLPLRVTVEDPDRVLSLDEHSCPRLFLRVRKTDLPENAFFRLTRFDEVPAVTCQEEPPGTGILMIGIDAGFATSQSHEGEYALDVSALVETTSRHLLVSATDKLQLSVVGGKFIQRHWSPPVKGVAVSLTLDKDVYALGSPLPLHIALENVGSQGKIVGMDPYDSIPRETFAPGVTVEFQAGDGKVSLTELLARAVKPVATAESWDGYCRRDFLPGLVFPIELTRSSPIDPGVYKVVASWKPSGNGSCGGNRSADYFTVKSPPVTLRVVDPKKVNLPEALGISVDK